MIINETRSRLVGEMYTYVSNIITEALRQHKKIIVWGCGKGGAFLRHLILDIDGRLPITYYIDEYMVLPCVSAELNIFRSSLLSYIDTKEYIILLSIRKDNNVEIRLSKYGYVKNINYFDVRSDIGGSYLEYLELRNEDVDFGYVTKEDRPDIYNGEYYESKPFDHSSIDLVFNVINQLPCEKSFFDIGCGKGQILLMAGLSGFRTIGGIDFNSELVSIAETNMHLLQIEAEVISGDASDYKDIDRYSIFFLYNPFGEKILLEVADNILNSYERRKRNIFIIYGNPFFHKVLISKNKISLYRQVKVDLYDPLLNIYSIGGAGA